MLAWYGDFLQLKIHLCRTRTPRAAEVRRGPSPQLANQQSTVCLKCSNFEPRLHRERKACASHFIIRGHSTCTIVPLWSWRSDDSPSDLAGHTPLWWCAAGGQLLSARRGLRSCAVSPRHEGLLRCRTTWARRAACSKNRPSAAAGCLPEVLWKPRGTMQGSNAATQRPATVCWPSNSQRHQSPRTSKRLRWGPSNGLPKLAP
jgi:hypothetical protein